MRRRRHKWSLKITLVSFLLITLLVTPTMATSTSTNAIKTIDRFELLNTWAYLEITDKPSPEYNYSEKIENRFLSMDEKTFQNEIFASIQKGIEKQNNGAIIIWDKEFISYCKNLFPDLGRTLESQNQLSMQQTNDILASSYTPGDTDETWYAYGDNAVGVHLVGLKCRIEWAWNTVQITSATPSTTGECYAPTWTYVGVTGTTQNFYDNNTRFKKWVSGKFRSVISGVTVAERTVELTINVYAGGSYSPKSGPY